MKVTVPYFSREPWEPNLILDRTTRTFTATLGPSGGKRGYQGLTGALSYYFLNFYHVFPMVFMYFPPYLIQA